MPVSPRATVAADPKFVPLGAPVFLALDRPEAYGFWVAQDTGGAIKGANRFDTFWGHGAEATQIAGGMSANGVALILVPKGSRAVSRALSPDEAELWARVTATIRPLSREPLKAEPATETRAQLRRSRRLKVEGSCTQADRRLHLRLHARDRRSTGPGTASSAPARSSRIGWSTFTASIWTAPGGRSTLRSNGPKTAGDRVILLITGHHRPGEPPVQRGRIRAAVHDWLAVSRHAGRIAAVRGAHPRHGGGGSLYIVLRRR